MVHFQTSVTKCMEADSHFLESQPGFMESLLQSNQYVFKQHILNDTPGYGTDVILSNNLHITLSLLAVKKLYVIITVHYFN